MIAVEAETVPVTAGLRHQSENVEAATFHFVNLVIVLHLSDKKDFGVAFQERKQSGTRTSAASALSGKMGTLRAIKRNRKFQRSGQDRKARIQGINKLTFGKWGCLA
jgi:hypothetical protein